MAEPANASQTTWSPLSDRQPGPGLLTRARLFWHTAAHLRPAQAVARARLRSSAAWRRLVPGLAIASYRREASEAALVRAPTILPMMSASGGVASGRAAAARDDVARRYLAGDVEYLHTAARVGRPSDWRYIDATRLWRYHLQYFDELPIAALAGEPSDVISLMREWIAAYPFGADGDAWHPYVTSLRAVNWMRAASILEGRDSPVPDDVLDAMRVDALFVRHNLEEDVSGNHLLKNLKALAFASAFWTGARAEQWRTEAIERWERELGRQVLADGGHYERAPMYHCQVLGDLLETIAVLAPGGPLPDAFADAARRMTAFLDVICHPDGDIALFNDSVFGAAPSPTVLRSLSAALLEVGSVSMPLPRATDDSGFRRIDSRDRRLTLIVDVGEPCPPDLPAHAHADLLSFELSVDGRRVVVDSGVAEYEAGTWRDYWRSTRAHNTVMVDGVEQTECWGSFRVARRAHPESVREIEQPSIRGISAAHTGYRHLANPVRHRRSIAFVDDRCLVVVDDLLGTGAHRWTSYIHFHPDVEIRRHDTTLRVATGTTGLEVAWTGVLEARCVRGEVDPPQGWYASEFGRREPSSTLVLDGSGSLPARFALALVPFSAVAVQLAWERENVIAVTLGQDIFRLSLPDLT